MNEVTVNATGFWLTPRQPIHSDFVTTNLDAGCQLATNDNSVEYQFKYSRVIL